MIAQELKKLMKKTIKDWTHKSWDVYGARHDEGLSQERIICREALERIIEKKREEEQESRKIHSGIIASLHTRCRKESGLEYLT